MGKNAPFSAAKMYKVVAALQTSTVKLSLFFEEF